MDNTKNKGIKGIIGLVLVAIALIFTVITVIQGIQVKTNDNLISVSGGLLYSQKVEYSDISKVEKLDSISIGTRTNGMSLLNYQIGHYSNKEYGAYKLFVDTKINEYIVITYDNEKLVFNYKSVEETEQMYNMLMGKIK